MQFPTRDPAANEELKKQQQGDARIQVNLHLPGGQVESYEMETAKEIGYVKGLHVKAAGTKVAGIRSVVFRLKGQQSEMIDPLSICDFPGVSPPSVDIEVSYR